MDYPVQLNNIFNHFYALVSINFIDVIIYIIRFAVLHFKHKNTQRRLTLNNMIILIKKYSHNYSYSMCLGMHASIISFQLSISSKSKKYYIVHFFLTMSRDEYAQNTLFKTSAKNEWILLPVINKMNFWLAIL